MCDKDKQTEPSGADQADVHEKQANKTRCLLEVENPLTYGELVILGYNGRISQDEKYGRKSKFVLFRRPVPNGVKKSRSRVVRTLQCPEEISDFKKHSVTFSVSKEETVIVEYEPDPETDMFQIGRCSDASIDFPVFDAKYRNKNESKARQPRENDDRRVTRQIREKIKKQSTISRYACRIVIQRSPNYVARLYAAGFDSNKNIFLGEKAIKWDYNGENDGLTTNGILIMHPRSPFCNAAVPGIWREVSVGGNLHISRANRSVAERGEEVDAETNVLQDGTLIDLCGVTLLWRSAEGLNRSPTQHLLKELIDELNAGRPRCPVRLNTLIITHTSTITSDDEEPYVYLSCGHVQGYHQWGKTKDTNSQTCPICRTSGSVVKLTMGIENAFYVDCAPPNFAFNPCGHMASEKTIKYWASIGIPHGVDMFQAACPFCNTPLNGVPGYVKLIFQDHID